MLHARISKHSNLVSFPHASTRKPARRSARGNRRLGRAALAAAVEALETRRLMTTYTFTNLQDLGAGTSGTNPSAGLYMDSSGDLFGTTQNGGEYGYGTIFEIQAGQTSVQTLYSFNEPGPAHPEGGLIADSSGNLYGTTYSGGASSPYYGAIYKFNPTTDQLTTLASVSYTTGEHPEGSLYMDSNGNLYGTTLSGGVDGNGVIFVLPHNSSNVQVLASFGSGNDGACPFYCNVIMDSSGNLYGTTTDGGPDELGNVWELAHGSTAVTDLVDFTGGNGEYPYGGLAMDSSGNLYGTTSGGGEDGGTVFEITAGTHNFSTLVDFSGSTGTDPLSGLFVDSSGNLFGTTTQGVSGTYGTIFEIPAADHSTVNVLGDFTQGTGNLTNGAPLIEDSNGNLFGTAYQGGVYGMGEVFELSPIIATQAVFTYQPNSTVTAGSDLSFQVNLENNAGMLDTGNTSDVTLSITSGPDGATIGGTTTVAAVGGFADFNGLELDETGTYTLTASSPGLTSATSRTITVDAASPDQLVFAEQPTGSITAGASLGTVLVAVVDQYGNVCTDGDSGNVTLSGTSLAGASNPLPTPNGVATFTGLSMTQAGLQTLTATDGSASTPSATSSSFTITPAAASQVVFSTQPGNGFVGMTLGAVEASIEDQYGNLETTDTPDVTLAIGSNPGSATLGGTLTQAAVAGVATFSDLGLNHAGTGYTLGASSSGVTSAVSTPFNITGIAVWTGDGHDGQWNTAANWQGDAVPITGQPVDFPDLHGSTVQDVTLATNVTVGNITLEGNYSFSGANITVNGNITASNTDDTFGNSIILTHDTTMTVGEGDELIYTGSVQDGGEGYGVTFAGGGTVIYTLGGQADYSGANVVQDGTLDNESEVDSAITVDAGGTVEGSGQYDAGIVGDGGIISLGNSSSSDQIEVPTITFSSGTTLNEELYSGDGIEGDGELVVNGGTINLTGSILTVSTLNGFTPAAGDVITLIANQTGSAVTGTFNGLAQGALLTSNGVQYQINYDSGSGHNVTLTVLGPAVWTGDGGDGNWNTADNWQADTVPLAGQNVDFPDINGSTPDNVNLANDVTVGNITMEGNDYFGGSDLTVNGNITASGSDDEFQDNLDLNHNTTISVGSSANVSTSNINDSGSDDGITLTGGGTLVFNGTTSYDGTTNIVSGTLDNEAEVTSSVTVDAGGTVEGAGLFDTSIVGNGGTISLGNGASIYYVGAPAVSFANGTTLHEELSSSSGSENDGQLVDQGSINLTGSNLTLSTQNGFAPALGDVITLISNQTGSAVTGTFNGLAQGAITAFGGVHYRISYTGGESGHDVTLTVVKPPPTVVSVMPALATSSVRPALSILGQDPTTHNDSDLTYTWTVTSAPSGAPTVKFSDNATNTAKDATARFQQAGTYHLLCTIGNNIGETTTATVSITIKQVATSLRLSPHGQHIEPLSKLQFSGIALDQFGNPMAGTQPVSYAMETADGTINASGLFSAGAAAGHVVIEMTIDGLSGTVTAVID